MSFNILNMNYRVVFLMNFFSFLNENSFEIEKNLLQIKKKLSNKDLGLTYRNSNVSNEDIITSAIYKGKYSEKNSESVK